MYFVYKLLHWQGVMSESGVLLVWEALQGQQPTAYTCKNYLCVSIWRHCLLPSPQTQMIKAEQCWSLNYFLLLQLAAGCSFANSLCDGCEFNFSNTLEQSNYDLESWQAFKYGLRIFLMISLTVELKKNHCLQRKEAPSMF